MIQLDSNSRLLLLASTHIAALPLYPSMPWPMLFFIFFISGWLILIIRKNHFLRTPEKKHYNLNLGLRLLLIVCSFLLLHFTYGAIFGRQPGITMVLLMSLLKMFEIKSKYDTHIIIFTNIFLLATHFFLSQNIWIAAYVFITIIFMMALLISVSREKRSATFLQPLGLSARMVFTAIPFMIILFVLFPRIPGPLWGLPDDAFTASSGISEKMSPGSINRLIQSSAIAFRVRFSQAAPSHNQLYWRGAVLSDYDGSTWHRQDSLPPATLNLPYRKAMPQNNKLVGYQVTLEPHNLHWVFSLDYPVQHDSSLKLNREAMLLNKTRVTQIQRYDITSDLNAENRSLLRQEKIRYLQLPRDFNPDTLNFARQRFADTNYNRQAYVQNIMQFFREQNFRYTLSPPLLGKHAMDDFLFGTRLGFCEHYASAFVTLMRAAGIPARVVIGYMGGKINPFDNYMEVRQSDAHAWTEIWIDNHWQRMDPTAAVAPDRIENGILDAGLEVNRLPILLVSKSALLQQARQLFDSMQNNWNQWVIGYNQQKQKDLLSSLGLKQTDAANLILWLVLCMTLTGLIIAAILFRSRPEKNDKVQKYYGLLCKKLARAGLPRYRHEASLDYQLRLCKLNRQHNHFSTEDLISILSLYRNLHYGKESDPNLKKQLLKKVKAFRVRRK